MEGWMSSEGLKQTIITSFHILFSSCINYTLEKASLNKPRTMQCISTQIMRSVQMKAVHRLARVKE
jgi:hypothetical protein